MMDDQVLICPNCGEKIQITETLAALVEKDVRKSLQVEIDEQLRLQKIKLQKDEKAQAEKNQKEFEKTLKKQIDDQIAEREKENKKLKKDMQDFKVREEELSLKEKELDNKIKAEIKQARKDLTEKLTSEFQEEYEEELEKKNRRLRETAKQLREMKRKIEQGSQQEQGEILEEKLEKALKREFPDDEIIEVAKGKKGGDVIQKVVTKKGKIAGKIVWESKNTKNFAKTWITKIKKDIRKEKADVGVIVTVAMPKDFDAGFGRIEGIWVTDFKHFSPLALALRSSLLDIHTIKATTNVSDKQLKVIYDYLTGVEFNNRVEAIVEAFVDMASDIEKERVSAERNWAKREQTIRAVLGNVAGMYGEIGVISGAKLPEIKRLEISSG